MGFPLDPAIANIFMCSFESRWLRDCPNDFKTVFYSRYVNDIFALFSSPDHIDQFKEYLSLQIRTIINRIMKNKLPCCNIQFDFQTKCKISNFFAFKHRIPSFLRSSIVYKFQCGGCNATYYGKTKRHFKVRICEHFGISEITRKRVKCNDDLAIKKHLLLCNHQPGFEDFSILTTNNNGFKITLMKTLLTNRDHLHFNKNKQSLLWELFYSYSDRDFKAKCKRFIQHIFLENDGWISLY